MRAASLALLALLVATPALAGDPRDVALVRLLGPRATDALAPSSNRLGLLVAIPAGQSAVSLGLDEIAPGFGMMRGDPASVVAFGQAHPSLVMEVSPPSRMMLDHARFATQLFQSQLVTSATGKGAAVGVIDTGLDVLHPDFFDPVTLKSRVAWYLDLSQAPLGLHADLEQKFGVKDGSGKVILGAVYSGADIDARILAKQTVPSDEVGHGTHVTSIAASDPGAGTFGGFAPKATLIIARASRSASSSFENADIITGTQFVFDRADALGIPVVANLSLGSDFGPHDGTTLWEQALMSSVGPSHPGHAIVVAAGNSGSVIESPIHQNVHVSAGSTVKVPITSGGAQNGTVQVWVTEHAGATLSIGLDGPDGTWISPVKDGDQVGKNTTDYNAGVIHGSGAQGTSVPKGSRGATVIWSGKWPAGTYAITLKGEGTAELYLDGTGDASLFGRQPTSFTVGIREGTVDLPSTHPDAIAVGATVNRDGWKSITGAGVSIGSPVLDHTGRLQDRTQVGSVRPVDGDVAWFSGAGPNALGVPKPDILAPGGIVVAAMSAQAKPGIVTSIFSSTTCPPDKAGNRDNRCLQVDERHAMSLGTSMAAPMVAGVAALLFERNPLLTQDEIRALLQAGAHRVRGAGPFYDQSGPGEIDVLGALSALDDMKNPSLALPDAQSSWLSLSQGYAPADGSIPLTVILELRSASGHHANLFDMSRLRAKVLVDSRPMLDAPEVARSPSPGLFLYRVSLPPGLGGESLTLGATFDGLDIVSPVTIPIATDAWTSTYSARTKGGCAVSEPEAPRPLGASLAVLAIVATYIARRRARNACAPSATD